MDVSLIVVVVVMTALVFDFTNGFHDRANAMATPIPHFPTALSANDRPADQGVTALADLSARSRFGYGRADLGKRGFQSSPNSQAMLRWTNLTWFALSYDRASWPSAS